MIRCGWCGMPTGDGSICGLCGRDPGLPWRQRGKPVPVIGHHDAGRPPLDAHTIRSQYGAARLVLLAAGRTPTVEAIAEELGRTPRTVREWRVRFGLD